MVTDLHLQISQHQARLKHENFTVSYHSYPTPYYYRKTFCKHFAAMNCICSILPNFIVSIWCCEVKLSWIVATVVFIALHDSLMLMQCSEALPFLQNILVEVIGHLPLEMCICTHSLVVDHIGQRFLIFLLLWPIFSVKRNLRPT